MIQRGKGPCRIGQVRKTVIAIDHSRAKTGSEKTTPASVLENQVKELALTGNYTGVYYRAMSSQANGAAVMVSRRRYDDPAYVYHVLNRGAERQQLLFSDDDYREFEALIEETTSRTPLWVLTYELMPDHWHFGIAQSITVAFRGAKIDSYSPRDA